MNDRRETACAVLGLDPGYARVPVTPTAAMLRPFFECPAEELELAWAAMLKIAATMNPPPSDGGESINRAFEEAGWRNTLAAAMRSALQCGHVSGGARADFELLLSQNDKARATPARSSGFVPVTTSDPADVDPLHRGGRMHQRRGRE